MRVLLIASLMVLSFAGTVSAHATYSTDDGKVKIILGQLGEPVYTYQRSGLDLILRDNVTGAEIPGVAGTLNATWIAPGGQELPCPLKVQHGAVGRYTCVDAWTLTQPGLYKLRIKGSINGSAVDGTYANKHEINEQADIMFPDKGLPTIKELKAMIAELEHHAHEAEEKAEAAEAKAKAADEKAAALRTELDALKAKVDKLPGGTTTTQGVPGFEAALGLAALGTVALGLRLRRR